MNPYAALHAAAGPALRSNPSVDWPLVRERFIVLKEASRRAVQPGLSGVEQRRRTQAVADAKAAFVAAFPVPQMARNMVGQTIDRNLGWRVDWAKWPPDHYPTREETSHIAAADEFAAIEAVIDGFIARSGSRPAAAPVPATPFDALHAAAGDALRAWMDTHRDAVKTATDAVHIVFSPPAGLFAVGVTRSTGRIIQKAGLNFAPTGEQGVWLQRGSPHKTSLEGAVILSVQGSGRWERDVKGGGYSADPLVSTKDTVRNVANRLRTLLEADGTSVRLSENLRASPTPKLGEWLAGFYTRHPALSPLSRRAKVFKSENAPRETGKRPPIVLYPDFWLLPPAEQDAAFSQELLRRFPA